MRQKLATIVSPNEPKQVETPSKVFSSAQAYGKAISHLKKSLPKSPRRKVAVVKKLATSFGLPLLKPTTTASKTVSVVDDIDQQVISFYESDSISRQLPGKRDFVTVV